MSAKRSFSIVDHKVAEAGFFLRQLRSCGLDFFAARCFVSAFVSAARSVTFAIQSGLRDVEGFDTWYQKHQDALRANETARFFHDFRTVSQHIGDNVVTGGSLSRESEVRYWFSASADLPAVPKEDVVTACTIYLRTVLEVVFDSYIQFGPLIDAHQRYTAEYFASLGKSIEDAEEELGFPRGWTDIGDASALPYRWQSLRDHEVGCEINELFQEYLGKITLVPNRLPPYVAGETEM